MTVNKLVVLGGWSGLSRVMLPCANALAQTLNIPMQVLRYPGYEDAENFPVPSDEAQGNAPWALESLFSGWEHQIDEQTLVMGWSLGGMLAVALAAHRSVAGVITLGSNRQFQGGEPWQMPAAAFQSFSKQFQRQPAKTLDRFIDLAVSGDPVPAAMREQVVAHTQRFHPQFQSLADSLALLGSLDLQNVLPNCPQLHVLAEHDALVPVVAAQEWAKRPHTQVQVLAGSHCLPLSPEVAPVIAAWCRKQWGDNR